MAPRVPIAAGASPAVLIDLLSVDSLAAALVAVSDVAARSLLLPDVAAGIV